MLSAGIVGLPNVGKSTLFNAVTRTRKAQAANYPFCTIDPNVGVVIVPDPRLEALSKLSGSKKIVPAAIEFVDIAGLVKGASSGEGLGNQFLSHIREVNAIVQVVRCFEDDDIHHVAGSVDPVRDIEVINTELILADLASVQKRMDRQQKMARTGDKQAKAEIAVAEKLIPHLDAGKPALTLELTEEEAKIAKEFFLMTNKPTIFACNVAESELANVSAIVEAANNNEAVLPTEGVDVTGAAKYVKAVQDYARAHFATEAVVISAQIESELVDLSAEEAADYLKDLGVSSSGVGSLIRAVYHLLGLRTYLTTGEQET
ncbi:MAG: redox-regulated ATPase YchF, partial [Verrucomicrobiaceae bacterium]